jgi:uncharacterized protein (DUF2236 family)
MGPDHPFPRRPTPSGALEWVRTRLALEVSDLLIGDNPPAVERRSVPFEEDPGYFGPDSITWRVHADSCTLIGGLRALMLQTMHPLAMAGVAQHSNFRSDPLGRLANTSVFVGTTIYGTRPDVERAIRVVKRVHEEVVGVAPDGRPYAANDPHLLTFVHHTLVDSFLRANQRYGAQPLTPAEADRYVEEQAVLAELFDAEPAARSVAELKRWFLDLRPELRATGDSRDTIRFLLNPPLPLVARPAYAVVASGAVTMLPAWIRRQLWLPVPPVVEPVVVRPTTTALVRIVDWVMGGYPREREAPAELEPELDPERAA